MALSVWTLMLTFFVPLFFGVTPVQADKPTAVATPTQSPKTLAELAQIHFVSITHEDMKLMRQDPSEATLRTVYARYKPAIDEALPEWDLDEDGFALVFATLVAYQAAPYGPEDGPVNTLDDMFALGKIECRGYSLFVAKLFYQLQQGNRWKIYLHGFDGAKFIGNHAQVIAVDTTSVQAGITKKSGLVLDATVGVVAKVDLDALPLPASSEDVLVLGQRKNKDVSTIPSLQKYRLNVVKGLTTPGTYVYAKMIYQEDASVFYNVGTVDPNLKTAIGVIGRTLYVLPDEEADTSKGVWQQFYTYIGYGLYPPYNPAVLPYRICDASAPGRESVCACISNQSVLVPWVSESMCEKTKTAKSK